VARYLKSQTCKRVVFMLGAGISTSAGIPDFRSPETGLYANLARLNLPFPEAVFEINFFRNNPIPFYTLAKEMQPSQYRPTPTHSFIKLLADKQLLHICLTQNIDTLERRAGVPAKLIVEAHGSFATQCCIKCKRPFDDKKMKEAVMNERVPHCENKKCGGLVKPDIVFFGEGLPASFHQAIPKLMDADLLIVIGTSLTVHPFASLALLAPEGCPRVLINQEKVGDFGSREDDIILLGRCDDIIRDLAKELGWDEDLEKEWAATASLVQPNDSAKGAKMPNTKVNKEKRNTGQEHLKEEVDKLTNQLGRSLALSETTTAIEGKQEAAAKVANEPVGPAMGGIASQERSRSAETAGTEGEPEAKRIENKVIADVKEPVDIKASEERPEEGKL